MVSKILRLAFVCWIWTLQAQAQSSVLATGEWYKIGITQTGMYRIDANTLRRMGISLSGLNPRNIRLFGNGGRMLPQANAATRAADLTENAILVTGETDGTFDTQDNIIFYGQSPHVVFYDEQARRLRHETNVYSDTTYYFLQIASVPGLRVQNAPAAPTATQTFDYFDEYVFHENDTRNLVNSGREWYGEDFGLLIGERTFSFDLPDVLPSSVAILTSSVVGAAFGTTGMRVQLGGQVAGTQTLFAITPERYDYKGREVTDTYTLTLGAAISSPLNATLTFDRRGINGLAYLNYLGLQCRRGLRFSNKQLVFRNVEGVSYPAARYSIKNPSNAPIKVWDVSSPLQPQQVALNTTTSEVSFTADGRSLRTFVAYTDNLLRSIDSFRPLPNQNLRAAAPPNLLIVSAAAHLEQAQRLAAFRQTTDGLQVLVVTADEVFNEFASGQPDVSAIRDAAKFFYNKAPQVFRYLLLFGDASHDYKNRLEVLKSLRKDAFVPVYESRESLSPLYSYSSDDYFGFLENTEGDWTENFSGDHTLDIGVGRIPAKTPAEARTVVDKLIRYATAPEALGDWRQYLTFVADDGDANIHQGDADYLAQVISTRYPAYQVRKIFVDAFPQINGANGQRAPLINKAINNYVDKSLIMNYTGHGGDAGWAEEQILTRADMLSWNNTAHLPLFVTATCEFGRYDDPNVVSGAEITLLSAKGGGIGLLTTTRPVFANTNFLVNEAFYRAVFEPINGNLPRLGDVLRLTKNNSLSGRINRNFALLGDPSMQLNYPKQQVVVTTLNTKALNQTDTLRPLQQVSLSGEIRTVTTKNTTFNGQAHLTLLDKASTSTTLGTESSSMSFAEQKKVLFEGLVSVRNGTFSINFTLPKDIEVKFGYGKLLLYAQTTDGQLDASGGLSSLVLGGSALPNTETQPPQIQAFINTESFKNGDTVPSSSTLVVKLLDDTGLNLTQSPGRALSATLNDTLTWILNDFYEATLDKPKSGTINFPLRGLPEATHRLVIKAWDLANNASTASLSFKVVEDAAQLRNVLAFPNPFSAETSFSFEHDWTGQDLEIGVDIIDATGRVLHSQQFTEYQAASPVLNLRWDGKSNSGEKIARGLYFYRIFARSLNTQKQVSGSGKVLFWP